MFTVRKHRIKADGTYSVSEIPLLLRPGIILANLQHGVRRREEYKGLRHHSKERESILNEWVGDSSEVLYEWWNRIGEKSGQKGRRVIVKSLEEFKGGRYNGSELEAWESDNIPRDIAAHSELHYCSEGGILIEKRSGEKIIFLYGNNPSPLHEYVKDW